MSDLHLTTMPTPHISANCPSQIAKTVLMPGDPLRAKFIADTFLTDVKQFNVTRGMLGFTGMYNDKRVSVMGHGMGMPSMGIYSYELFNIYNVDNIIRIGTAGSMNENVNVRDVVIAMGACTNSNYAHQFGLSGTFSSICSYLLLTKADDVAKELGIDVKIGNILTSDTFYEDEPNITKWGKMGVLAVEMEVAALYMNAARAGKNALAILTIADELLNHTVTTAEERQTSFTNMMKIALALA